MDLKAPRSAGVVIMAVIMVVVLSILLVVIEKTQRFLLYLPYPPPYLGVRWEV
jgi:hypothetical protein